MLTGTKQFAPVGLGWLDEARKHLFSDNKGVTIKVALSDSGHLQFRGDCDSMTWCDDSAQGAMYYGEIMAWW